MASAEAFTVLKIVGALYLIWLGIKAAREAGTDIVAAMGGRSAGKAFRDGIVVEALNPKTAAFFLAFLPQFVDPAVGAVWLQFLVLGLVSVTLNTAGRGLGRLNPARPPSRAPGRPGLRAPLRPGAGARHARPA